nr:putative epoxide hydrolase [Quercus suber]
MLSWTSKSLVVLHIGLLFQATLPCAGRRHDGYQVHPFHVDLAKGVPRMLELVRNTRLPGKPEYPGIGASAGIDLALLSQLQNEWLNDFDWQREEAEINRLALPAPQVYQSLDHQDAETSSSFDHFTVTIEGLKTHFIHQRSSDPDAIPLLLEHGWPGSFLEFIPTIKALTTRAKISNGKTVSFHVVVPSLPGFAFSEAPPANWTVDDTGRLHHTLMTKVLGYETFAVHGTDFGVGPAYSLYDGSNQTARAAHFAFLPFIPLLPEQLAERNISLQSSLEEFEEQRLFEWATTGNAYFQEQVTKASSKVEFYSRKIWTDLYRSDPRAGTSPSVFNHNEILRAVSLYYLTRSFLSSVYIYHQNPNGFKTEYTKARTNAPMFFSAFKYNVGFWPPTLVAQAGNLVSYRNHEFGGHFPGLDNPPALLDDLRNIGNYWK